jgi:hypothetical protein
MALSGPAVVPLVSVVEREDTFDFASPEWYIRQLRGVAQRLARMVWDHEAGGSNPLTPTINCHTRNPKFPQCGEAVQEKLLPRVWGCPPTSQKLPQEWGTKGVDGLACQFGTYNRQDACSMVLVAFFE